MNIKDQSQRFAKARTYLLVLALLFFLGYTLGFLIEPLALRYFFPVAMFLLCILLIYLSLLRFRKWFLLLLSVLFSLLIIEVALAGIELRSGYIDAHRPSDRPGEAAVLQLHPDLIYWMSPQASGEVSRRFGESVAYENVPFHTDNMGRRACPPLAAPAPQHAIFFGGSFTFGQGITDEQSVPCVFQERSSGEFQAYNYGKNGYGTGQMYWLLSNGEYFEPEMQQNGFAAYIFIADHIPRTVGEISKLTSEDLPWMDFKLFKTDEETGDLISYRIEENSTVYNALQGVRIFRLISPTARFLISRTVIPLTSYEEGVRITAEVIIHSKRLYEERFSGEFFVILWPRVGLDEPSEAILVELLEAEGIQVIDVPELPGDEPAQIHPNDRHPSVAETRWVAEYFQKHILEGNQ